MGRSVNTITGVGPVTAQAMIAEVGTGMRRFPSANHLTAWAGLAPGNNISAGKRKSGRTRDVYEDGAPPRSPPLIIAFRLSLQCSPGWRVPERQPGIWHMVAVLPDRIALNVNRTLQ